MRDVYKRQTYTYGDSNWKDLLTAFDGKAITYDANGNPTKYYNGGTMTWRNGRQLASYSLGGKTYRYEYEDVYKRQGDHSGEGASVQRLRLFLPPESPGAHSGAAGGWLCQMCIRDR